MADKLIPLVLPPGMERNGTVLQAAGRWYDGNLVRFTQDTIRPVGGWRRLQVDGGGDMAALAGVPRGAIGWRGSAGDRYLAMGTTQKLYLFSGGVLRDITPAGFVASSNVDSAPVTSTGAYGSGVYGTGAYGVGSSTTVFRDADNWQLDTFGDFLVGVCSSDNKLYLWSGNVAVPAAVPAGAPPTASGVVVTPEGFLVALGYVVSTGQASVRGLSWASQRTSTVWTALITNSAGDFDLSTHGRIMCGKRTRDETLIWTDVDVHVMRYIGGPLVYRFSQAGDRCGALSPRSPVVVDTRAMWMGRHNFFVYDGYVKPVPCDVADYVFGDFNEAQASKVWGMSVSEFGEAWWFYPSAASTVNDRYVVYNYRENHWTTGKISRSAGWDAGALPHPVMLTNAGVAYEHEQIGGLHTPTSVIEGTCVPYLESGPIQFGDGDVLMNAQRLVPDEKTLGDVTATIYSSLWPTAAEQVSGPYTLANPTSIRVLGRQIRIRIDQALEKSWRVGVLRFGARPSSRR